MVKKAKTPELPGEVRYYTCWMPYPNNADFEQPSDYTKFCCWIANILGNPKLLHAVYYRPKAGGMVILSVDKAYKHPKQLLGEHKYVEFLEEPDKDEESLVSRIYYSTYSTDSKLRDDGWNCIQVQDSFFNEEGFTKGPYPGPHWPRKPHKSLMEKTSCRQVSKPPELTIPATPPSVVGPSAWTERRNPGVSRTSFPPLSLVSPTAESARMPLSAPPAMNRHSVWENKPSNVKSAATNMAISASPSAACPVRANRRSKSRNSSAGNASSASPPVPSAGRKSSSISQAQSAKVGLSEAVNKVDSRTRATLDRSSIPGKPEGSSSSSTQYGGSSPSSAASSPPNSPPLSSFALPRDPVVIKIDVSEYDNNFDEEITEETYHHWGTHEPLVAMVKEETENIEGVNNLWAEVTVTARPTGSATAAEAHAKEKGENLCPRHKGKCKKGICEVYKQMQRREEMKRRKEAKAEAERQERVDARKKENARKKKRDAGQKEKEDARKKKEVAGPKEKEDPKQKKEVAEQKDKEGDKKEEEGETASKSDGSSSGDGSEKTTDTANDGNEGGQKFTENVSKSFEAKRWFDYEFPDDSESDDDDDLSRLPTFVVRGGGKKYYDDDEYFN
ncbi:hypothetical protein AX15_006199 [Amanita polypyramis BW_CC]|nr:hypothetical protein AX15_006199 [Amanita polypyramis BW_CC]